RRPEDRRLHAEIRMNERTARGDRDLQLSEARGARREETLGSDRTDVLCARRPRARGPCTEHKTDQGVPRSIEDLSVESRADQWLTEHSELGLESGKRRARPRQEGHDRTEADCYCVSPEHGAIVRKGLIGDAINNVGLRNVSAACQINMEVAG